MAEPKKSLILQMDIVVIENGMSHRLDMIDGDTGVDTVHEFIESTGALEDGQFEWCEKKGAYLVSKENFIWWKKIIEDNNQLNKRMKRLFAIYGRDAVEDIYNRASCCEIEDLAQSVNDGLDEAFGK